MKSDYVERSIQKALQVKELKKNQHPRLISDNGFCYISNDLNEYLNQEGIDHLRGKPNHPQTQGKIEGYHRSMKNIIMLDNYYFPEELEQQIEAFVDYYNYQRYHESLNNMIPCRSILWEAKRGRISKVFYKEKNINNEKAKLLRSKDGNSSFIK